MRLVQPINRRSSWRYPGGVPRLNKNHILYKDLRLCAVALPGGQANTANAHNTGGCYYDYVTNQISACGPQNVNHTTMTPVGPAIHATQATDFSARIPILRAETMQNVTMVIVLQAFLTAGNQSMLTFGANCNLTLYSNGIFEWRMNSGAIKVDNPTLTAISGHCYFYGTTYNCASGKSCELVLDLTTGRYSISHYNLGGALPALASGANYTLLTDGSGAVNGAKMAMGVISAKYLNDTQMLDYAHNFWDLIYPRRLDQLLAISSNYIGPPSALLPQNTTPPAITPSTTPSTEPAGLTVSTGVWTNSPTSYHYQWKSSGSNVGIDSANYTTSLTDVDGTITCIVTAVNATGSNSIAASNSIVVQGPPSAIVSPTISGSALATTTGTTITCNNGTWRGSPTFTYQWKDGATPISGATAQTYVTFNPADVGRVLTCAVTAHNAFSPDAIVSAGPSITVTGAPINTTLPSISGGTGGNIPSGGVLTCSTGVWTSGTLTYQWVRGGSINIGGATTSSYTTGSADVGFAITCLVTATNSSGAATATTSNSVTVTGAPVLITGPSISGPAAEPGPLHCDNGVWNGSPTFTYLWRRSGTSIGVTTQDYATTISDIGFPVDCQFTATNAGGFVGPLTTNAITVVAPSAGAPVNLTPPGISGFSQAPSVLTCNPGTWTNSPSFHFQWLRNGSTVVGADSATYSTVTADVGSNIGCIVTGYNGSGSQTMPITNQILVTSRARPLPSPAGMGITSSAAVELVEVLDSSDTWVPIGTVDPTTHTFVGVGSTGNRITNGDMLVDQRNIGSPGTASSGYTVDRWAYSGSQTGKIQWQRVAILTAPGVPPFPNCLQLTSLSGYSSSPSDAFSILQPIEAEMVSDFQWGTSSAQTVTLSFWAQSNGLAGTFSGAICNAATLPGRTRAYPFTFSIAAPSTWTRFSITIPGDTSGAGAWTSSGGGVGVCLFFDLGSGTNNLAPPGAWVTGPYVGATNSASVVGINNASLQITGVKLETGSVATPYERQTLASKQIACQRYYLIKRSVMLKAYAPAGTQIGFTADFPVTMRAAPHITLQDLSTVNAGPTSQANVTSDNVELYATVTATAVAQINCNIFADAEL